MIRKFIFVVVLAIQMNGQDGAKVAFGSPDDALRVVPNGQSFKGGDVRILRKLPDGRLETVPFNHAFRSGETVELRIRPNIDGYLTLYAKNDAGGYDDIFPHPRLYGGSAKVRDGEELTIPLTFDAKPSNTVLYLAVLSEKAESKLLDSLKTKKKAPPFADLHIKTSPLNGARGIAKPETSAPISSGEATGVNWATFVLKNQ